MEEVAGLKMKVDRRVSVNMVMKFVNDTSGTSPVSSSGKVAGNPSVCR